MKELKNVLERVEGKLIAAGKIYGAINFALWLAVMAIFYTLNGIVNMGGWASLVYWGTSIILAVPLTVKIWSRLERLYSTLYSDIEKEESRKWVLLIGLPWAIGSVVGWAIIPSTSWIGVNVDARLGVGFLSFIGISLLGQWIVMTHGRGEYEMIPSFLFPFLAIPIAWNIKSGTITWAGFVVVAGFSFTVLWYLYSAFKAIER